MQRIYTIILYLISPFVLLRLFWLARKNPDYRRRWSERFGFLPDPGFSKPLVWIHAVSVGEVHATKPLVRELLARYPQYQLIMTTMTPTGAFSVKQNYAADVRHIYLPYDLPFAIKRFLTQFQPSLLIVMETELWPNLFILCKQKNIPLVLINARLSERSMRGYQRLKPLTRKTLHALAAIGAQSALDAERFIALGACVGRVATTGNLKFDIQLPHSVSEQAQSLRRQFAVERPVWIAASTHAGEEEMILAAWQQVLQKHTTCLLMIAPRHPECFESVVALCKAKGFKVSRRSQPGEYDAATQVFVLDTLGELAMFYACADLAFVGGSLVPGVGGHNVLEPAALGLPIITGEQVFNFAEVIELLHRKGAISFVSTPADLAGKVTELLSDANLRHAIGENAKQVVQENRGAIEKVMAILEKYL